MKIGTRHGARVSRGWVVKRLEFSLVCPWCGLRLGENTKHFNFWGSFLFQKVFHFKG